MLKEGDTTYKSPQIVGDTDDVAIIANSTREFKEEACKIIEKA